MTDNAQPVSYIPMTDGEDIKAIGKIIDKTNVEKPKAADVAMLRKMLQESPKLWRVAGDFSEHALWTLTETIKATPFVVESVRAGVEKLREDLGYEIAPPLEKLLINQTALCWLRLNMVERSHCELMASVRTFEAGLYWERRLSTAQRRFTRACESLAKVRKLTSETIRRVTGERLSLVPQSAAKTA